MHIFNLLGVEPIDEEIENLWVCIIFQFQLLSLSLDKVSGESSIEEWRIVADEILVDRNYLR
jgi:hypothetical protein